MARGGVRPGAGRPFGARDAAPRGGKHYDRIKALSQEYDSTEFFVTNADKVFAGNSRELLVAIYKAEQLPVRVRLYAAVKACEYEGFTPISNGTPEIDTSEALIAAINKLRFTDEEQKKPPPQIIAPPLPRPRVRPKPASPVIDGMAEKVSAANGAQSGGKPAIGAASRQAIPKSLPETAPDSPVEEHEITAEETAVVSALPPHLLPGRWRRN